MASIIKPDRPKPPSPPRRLRNTPLAIISVLAVCAVIVLAIHTSVRRLIAEHGIAYSTLESLERAVRLTPQNSTGWVRLGRTQARMGAPSGHTRAHFQKAVEVSPYDSEAWIALAIQLELDSELAQAEEHLQKAYGINNGFESRWNLANFYLRQGRVPEFWHWIRETIAFAPRGFRPAVDLCWRAFDDPRVILDNGIPDVPAINHRYFGYLLETNRLDGATQVWDRMQSDLAPRSLGSFVEYVRSLLHHSKVPEALSAWNRLCELDLLPYEALSLSRGPLLTNAEFRWPLSGQGFDWRVLRPAGIQWEIKGAPDMPGEIEFSFSGTQQRFASLLEQLLPVEPNRQYRFDFTYLTQGLAQQSGIHWSVFDAVSNQRLARTASLDATEQPRLASLAAKTGKETRLLRLVLEYERAPGTTRKDGLLRTGNLAFYPDEKSGTPRTGGRNRP